MKVTDHTKAVLARRRAERERRKALTIADLSDRIDLLQTTVERLLKLAEDERQNAALSAIAAHYRREIQ